MPSIITTSAAVLLLVLHVLIMADDTRYKNCEYKELKKCNKIFMASFKQHVPALEGPFGVYCNGFQVYANCLSSSKCFGKFVDLNRFMILQHMIIDKTLQVCPLHNLDSLKIKVQVNKKYRKKIDKVADVDADSFKDCAAKIHRKCTSQMADNLSEDSRMCYGVENFLRCYENPGISCKAKIYKDFVNVVKKVAKTLVKMFKEKKGVMPNC